jgi:C-terminal processing protease CtpA/Prc
LYFSGFYLTPYLDDDCSKAMFGNLDPVAEQLAQAVRQTWQAWFDKVQELRASGQLKAVIIDLRGNSGGMLNDFQYVLGSMLPSGGFEVGLSRFKRGVGRYDYSPLVPFKVPTLETAHETITEPIVVLANCGSVSMAEITSLSCKQLSNGTLIGKRTHGGLCSLTTDPSVYYQNYSGIIGERGKTPVYLYIPQMTTVTKEGQILEGVGLTPDIEVDFDVTLYKSTGRDTQLERALQYCTTGQ